VSNRSIIDIIKYDIHLYHSYLSVIFVSAGVPNGEFPKKLIAKFRSRFHCTWFFSRAKILKVDARDGRDPQNRETNAPPEGSHVCWCGKCLQNHIISQRVEVLCHSSSLTPPLFIEMPITSHETKVSGEIYLCQGVDFASVFVLFRLDLQLFQQCGIYLIWPPFLLSLTILICDDLNCIFFVSEYVL
jgi:hypothetical protein